MHVNWTKWVRLARRLNGLTGLLIVAYSLLLSLLTLFPPDPNPDKAASSTLHSIASWLTARSDRVGWLGIGLVGAIVVAHLVVWWGLHRLHSRGERCPSISCLLTSLHARVTSSVDKPSRCQIVLYKFNGGSKLSAIAGSHGIPPAIESFRVNLHDEAKNKGIPGRCWFENRGRRRGDGRVPVFPQEDLPNLRTSPRVRRDDDMRTYSEATFDDLKRVRKTVPMAVCQVAYPIQVDGTLTNGSPVPWGVILLYSEIPMGHSERTAYLATLCESGGIVETIEDLLAKQILGQDLHCCE